MYRVNDRSSPTYRRAQITWIFQNGDAPSTLQVARADTSHSAGRAYFKIQRGFRVSVGRSKEFQIDRGEFENSMYHDEIVTYHCFEIPIFF